jgi:putative phosphoribosyl transferase
MGEIKLSSGKAVFKGELTIPDRAKGIVLFAHGSGSSRLSPRNMYVADVLHKSGIATLLIDLLTKEEESIDAMTGHLRFDIMLLAERVITGTYWLLEDKRTSGLNIGYFGASTGAAAALAAAARRPDVIKAVVSRGGRPDLAGVALRQVEAPTLLIVGGNDQVVIGMNREAMEKMHAEKKLVIIPGATHLFEEEGALEEVSRYACDWFKKYLLTGK